MNKKIKWGILGPGNIAYKFTDGLKHVSNAQLVAVGSRYIHKAKDFASKYGIPKAYGSYEELATDSEVDVIYIATPHVYHCEHTLLCLENNKAVLCEKPFAMNSQQGQLMIGKAREKNLFLMEAMWTRFLPTVQKVLELVHSGEIGDIVHIKSDFGFRAHFDDKGRLFNNELGGGSLLDIGIYPVFISMLLLGVPDEIISKASIGITGVDESVNAIFYYKSGATANLFSTLIANTKIETEIYGTKGQITIHRKWFMPSYITYTDNDNNKVEYHFEYDCNGYELEAREVTECLLQGYKESLLFPLKYSESLISVLDLIRKQCGINYNTDQF